MYQGIGAPAYTGQTAPCEILRCVGFERLSDLRFKIYEDLGYRV